MRDEVFLLLGRMEKNRSGTHERHEEERQGQPERGWEDHRTGGAGKDDERARPEPEPHQGGNRVFRVRSGHGQHRRLPQRDHLRGRRQRRADAPRLFHRGPGGALQFHRSGLSADPRRAADGRPAAEVLAAAEHPFDAARGHAQLLRQLSGGGAPDGGAVGDGGFPVELLSGAAAGQPEGGDRHHRDAPAVEAAHDRGVLLQEIDRRAVRVSEPQVQLLRELPEHDVPVAGLALRSGRPTTWR
jgi:hypothetical protein